VPTIPLRDYLRLVLHPRKTPAGVVAEYINASKRPGDRFVDTRTTPQPVAYLTDLAPAIYLPGTAPPRFFIPGPPATFDLSIWNAWLTERPYRQVILQADGTDFAGFPEPDLVFLELDEPVPPQQVILWEMLDRR
jgi:hypothetical protein